MLPSDGGSSETRCHCRGVGGGDEGDIGKRLWGNTEEYGSPLESREMKRLEIRRSHRAREEGVPFCPQVDIKR